MRKFFSMLRSIKITPQNIIITLLIIFAVATSIVFAKKGGDFNTFLNIAQELKEGKNIYSSGAYYCVFFFLLLLPFCNYLFLAKFLWLLLSYFLLYRIWILIKQYFDITRLTKKQYILWSVLVALYSIQFIIYNIHMLQITIFLLWGCLESLRLIRNKKEILGGMLLATLVIVKMMPLLLLPYLFYRGYFKSIMVTVLFFVVLLFVPALFIGVDYNNFLLSEWWNVVWNVINPANSGHLYEIESTGTHSLTALLPVYLMPTEAVLPYQRNIATLQPETIVMIITIARLFFLSISLFFLRSFPFKKENSKLKTFWEFSYFLMLIPLLLPHQQKYAFLFVIPMLSYIFYFFISTWKMKKTTLYWICLVCFIIPSLMYSPLYGSDVIGKFLFNYLQHYRILTVATLFFIPVALYCNPRTLRQGRAISPDAEKSYPPSPPQ